MSRQCLPYASRRGDQEANGGRVLASETTQRGPGRASACFAARSWHQCSRHATTRRCTGAVTDAAQPSARRRCLSQVGGGFCGRAPSSGVFAYGGKWLRRPAPVYYSPSPPAPTVGRSAFAPQAPCSCPSLRFRAGSLSPRCLPSPPIYCLALDRPSAAPSPSAAHQQPRARRPSQRLPEKEVGDKAPKETVRLCSCPLYRAPAEAPSPPRLCRKAVSLVVNPRRATVAIYCPPPPPAAPRSSPTSLPPPLIRPHQGRYATTTTSPTLPSMCARPQEATGARASPRPVGARGGHRGEALFLRLSSHAAGLRALRVVRVNAPGAAPEQTVYLTNLTNRVDAKLARRRGQSLLVTFRTALTRIFAWRGGWIPVFPLWLSPPSASARARPAERR